MRKQLLRKLLLLMAGGILLAPAVQAQEEMQPAFPGAEGFGRYVTDGRGGAVFHVTNLNDSGEGSLRWALSQRGTKTIVFDVSGTIHLLSPLSVSTGNVTIAGQTAPGDGICVADYPFTINASNVIIRFMRFRLGDKYSDHEGDGLGCLDQKDLMIDHCSVSWSVDECLSFCGCTNATVQWCISSQSMYQSQHAKGNHGYGGNWGGSGITYHHNLMIHHNSRTPRLGPRYTTQLDERMDMRNNVIYNWGGNGCYGGEAMTVNIVNNYYKPGPATLKRGTNIQQRIAGIGIRTKEYVTNYEAYKPTLHMWGDFYVDGNVNTHYSSVTNDNWTNGIYNQVDASGNDGKYTSVTKDTMKLAEPMDFVYVTTHSAEEAYKKVLQYVGASLSRDWVDTLMVYDARYGKASRTGAGNSNQPGIINTPSDNKPAGAGADWSAWPELESRACPADTDRDGMPDEWEILNGLDPNNAADRNNVNDEGYTMLEVYMNSLVAHIMDGGLEGGEPMGYTIIDENAGKGTSVVLSASTCVDNNWGFQNGYSISTSKGYATGKQDGIKYSRNQTYTINLPKDVEVLSADIFGYSNVDGNSSYLSRLGNDTFSATDYVYPSRSTAQTATHNVKLSAPVTDALPIVFSGEQTVAVITLWTRNKSTGIGQPVVIPFKEYVDVYTLNGQLFRKEVYHKHALHGLPSGVYVVGGRTLYWHSR